jgi:hypothetical protein
MQIDASVLGKDAETVVRKTGRRKKKEEEEDTPEEIARKAAKKEQYEKWGKGYVHIYLIYMHQKLPQPLN